MNKSRLRPFLIRLFLAFVLLAGIPVISINIIYQVFVTRLYTNELANSYQEKLLIAETILKMWEDEINKQAFAISMSEYLNQLDLKVIPAGQVPDYDYINSIKRLSSYLESIVSTNTKYYSISLLYENSDYLISSSSGLIVNESEYNYSYYQKIYSSGIKWITQASQEPGLSSNTDTSKILVYVIPFMQYVTNRKGFILFDMKEEELSSVINGGISGSGTGIFIFDKNGMIISDTSKENIGTKVNYISSMNEFEETKAETGFYPTKIGKTSYFIVYHYSASNEWYYCSLVPIDILNRRTAMILYLTVIITVGFLFLTILLSYINAKRLNLPVEKLEYRLEDLYLMQKIQGIKNLDPPPLYKNLFPFLNFCSVIIILDNYNLLAQNKDEESIGNMKIKIIKICLEILPGTFRYSSHFMEPNSITIIINFIDCNLTYLADLFIKLQNEIIIAYKNTISIGIGEICSEDKIQYSYSTARLVISRRLLAGPGKLFKYNPENEQIKGYFYPYDKENIFFNHLRLHETEATTHDLNEFFKAIREEKGITVDNTVQACNRLLDGIIKYIVELGISSREIFSEESNLYMRLSRFEFIDEIENFFAELLNKIIYFENQNGKYEELPINKIMNYIRANINKPFDLNALSDHVGISYSHVRRIFTGEMGEGILTYVYKKKVELSKKLLKETNTPVNIIIENLGFYNKQSFYRFFKKFEGITPNKYREMEENEL
ncbi:MAG: helix-turn-helix domain-containing protein [Treponema sp.]|nr:helix-turn-helix domain-containing protein [Treponema sp.]